MPMLKSQILKSVGLKNLDISRMKNFFFKLKKFINNIYFMAKNTFVAEVTFKG